MRFLSWYVGIGGNRIEKIVFSQSPLLFFLIIFFLVFLQHGYRCCRHHHLRTLIRQAVLTATTIIPIQIMFAPTTIFIAIGLPALPL